MKKCIILLAALFLLGCDDDPKSNNNVNNVNNVNNINNINNINNAICSETNPEGTCETGLFCIEGACVNPCDPNPCLDANQGVCTGSAAGAVCSCDPGFAENPEGGCEPGVEIVFIVDVTGTAVAIDTFTDLTNPPPPAGTGVVHLAGNLVALGEWAPNVVAMRDDGVAPDAVAGDNLWTLGFTVLSGATLQYKYSCGDAGAGWGGTEEYPMTNRGFTVAPEVEGENLVRVVLHDVFADRAEPSGSQGPLSTVDYVYAE